MTNGLGRVCAVCLGGLMWLHVQPAAAKPLSSEECARLVEEHAELAKKGIEKRMDQDAAEASKTLKPDQLQEIERFLFVEGEIRFRCPEIKLAIPEPSKPAPAEKTAEEKSPKEKKAEEKVEKPAGPPMALPNRKPAQPKKRAG